MKKLTKKLFALGLMLAALVPTAQAASVKNITATDVNGTVTAVNEEAMTDSAKS